MVKTIGRIQRGMPEMSSNRFRLSVGESLLESNAVMVSDFEFALPRYRNADTTSLVTSEKLSLLGFVRLNVSFLFPTDRVLVRPLVR